MSRTALLWLIILLSFIGVADTWYLAYSALTDTALSCGINVIDGCNTVAQSEYSRLLGIPLGIYGVVFYILTFITAGVLLVLPKRVLSKALLALSVIGLVFSLYFLALQVFVIKALCVYCLVSIALSLLIFAFSYRVSKRFTLLPTA